jgi:cytochrome c-type biogenesis protein CcmE
MTKHILSKSTFMYGCQCPKRLYLHKFKPELSNEEDEQQTAIFAAGTNAGVLARDLYKDGFDATPPNSYSYHIAVAQTAEQIANGQTVIYEAAFQYDGVMCAVDILVKKEDGWHAFEVKSTNSLKAQHQDDAALQHYVVSKSGLPLKEFSVVHFNRNLCTQRRYRCTAIVCGYFCKRLRFNARKLHCFKN